VVMPFLSTAQRRAGRELGSASAVADSKQTLLCTYLSAVRAARTIPGNERPASPLLVRAHTESTATYAARAKNETAFPG